MCAGGRAAQLNIHADVEAGGWKLVERTLNRARRCARSSRSARRLPGRRLLFLQQDHQVPWVSPARAHRVSNEYHPELMRMHASMGLTGASPPRV